MIVESTYRYRMQGDNVVITCWKDGQWNPCATIMPGCNGYEDAVDYLKTSRYKWRWSNLEGVGKGRITKIIQEVVDRNGPVHHDGRRYAVRVTLELID